jgi:hypothetical protein
MSINILLQHMSSNISGSKIKITIHFYWKYWNISNLKLVPTALQLREGAIKISQKVDEYVRLVTPGNYKTNFIFLCIARHVNFGRNWSTKLKLPGTYQNFNLLTENNISLIFNRVHWLYLGLSMNLLIKV